MAGGHGNQNLGIRQGQLVVTSQNFRTGHPGNIKNALRPFSEAFDQSRSHRGDTLRRSRPVLDPNLLKPDVWQSGLGLVAHKSRHHTYLSNHRLNILLYVSWRERPGMPEGAGLGHRREERRRPAASLLLGGSLLGGSLLRSGSRLRRSSFLRSSFGHVITSLFKDILA
jgi:hypothetical protein